jgi:cell division protein FtsL
MALTEPTLQTPRTGAPQTRRGADRAKEAPAPETPVRSAVRPFLRRWMAAMLLLVASTLAVLYISNSIAVDDLLADIASLEHDRDQARGDNEKLRAELLRLMAVDRVTSLAASRLGMTQPAQPPLMIGQTVTVTGRGDSAAAGVR